MARMSELTKEGVTAATIARMREKGLILQLSRGLYQLPDAGGDSNHALAEAAKLVPKGVVCLISALAFHELTDTHSPQRMDRDRTQGPAACRYAAPASDRALSRQDARRGH